jgi:carbon storage regulator
MLVLSRKLGQEVVIGGQIRLKVVGICGGRVRLGFAAPTDVPIHRGEFCRSSNGCGRAPPVGTGGSAK